MPDGLGRVAPHVLWRRHGRPGDWPKDEDAVEEEAPRAQQREALEALDEDDFALDGDDDDAGEEESGDLFAALGRKGGARRRSTAKQSRSELWRCSRRPSRAPSQVRQS